MIALVPFRIGGDVLLLLLLLRGGGGGALEHLLEEGELGGCGGD